MKNIFKIFKSKKHNKTTNVKRGFDADFLEWVKNTEVEKLNYTPVVIPVLRERASYEYFKTSKL